MLHLGSIRGTSIDVDFNFVILIVLFVAMNYNQERGLHYALLWIPVLFLSVLVHELAHAAMIGIFGFGPSHIVLTGMGGVTINSRRAKPWQDLLISVAGPLSSFGLMFLALWIRTGTHVGQTDKMLLAFLPLMMAANLFWGFFNLIPLAPLDGGHATRDFFRMFLNERQAFTIATWIGIVVGAGVVAYALRGKQFIMAFFIGWFIYLAWQRWQEFRRTGIPAD
jgi:Zn-dependent protease